MPECGYCKDCKHWQEYTLMSESMGEGECSLITEALSLYPSKAALEPVYDEPMNARLETTSTFGCVMFEPET